MSGASARSLRLVAVKGWRCRLEARSLRHLASFAPVQEFCCETKRVSTPYFSHGRRRYHFASSAYDSAFGSLPSADPHKLREETLKYVSQFDPASWYDDPVCTIVHGVRHADGDEVNTVDTLGAVNGRQILAGPAAYAAILAAMRPPPVTDRGRADHRNAVRRLEAELLAPATAAALIGNQMLDFKKQDGITEIEEAVQANAVERRLNDQLLADEELGRIHVRREAPAVALCVNNFSNFLDLCRKVLRHIEVGVPVVVASRLNTGQHTFRWAVILFALMRKHEVPLSLLTFASLDIPHVQALVAANPDCPVHFTGSRDTAARIRPWAPRLMASTAGPNTMLASGLSPAVAQAVRWSACIEHSGQCTALRHLVLPDSVPLQQVAEAFQGTPLITAPEESLARGEFAALFGGRALAPAGGYRVIPGLPVALRASKALPEGIQEHWREVYLDVTQRPAGELESEGFVNELSAWLVREQPISVAVNGPLSLGVRLWERTGQVVFNVGSPEHPALSCQARPQEGECFGEFPPRAALGLHTRFPMIIPSPVAAYNAAYAPEHLSCRALAPVPAGAEFCRPLLEGIQSPLVRGYVAVLLAYLCDAAVGPRPAKGARTGLYGLQRPPMDGRKTIIRCPGGTSLDDVAPLLLPFFATNAREQVEISCEPARGEASVVGALAAIDMTGIRVREEADAEFRARAAAAYNAVMAAPLDDFPLAGQWVSTLLCCGHVKTVLAGPDADAFVAAFTASDKWLRIRHPATPPAP